MAGVRESGCKHRQTTGMLLLDAAILISQGAEAASWLFSVGFTWIDSVLLESIQREAIYGWASRFAQASLQEAV